MVTRQVCVDGVEPIVIDVAARRVIVPAPPLRLLPGCSMVLPLAVTAVIDRTGLRLVLTALSGNACEDVALDRRDGSCRAIAEMNEDT